MLLPTTVCQIISMDMTTFIILIRVRNLSYSVRTCKKEVQGKQYSRSQLEAVSSFCKGKIIIRYFCNFTKLNLKYSGDSNKYNIVNVEKVITEVPSWNVISTKTWMEFIYVSSYTCTDPEKKSERGLLGGGPSDNFV